MHRRNILATALAAAGGLLAAGGRSARADAREGAKAVYHLGNIDHHLEGAGGPEKVTIALVVHGAALRAFHAASASPETARKLAALVKADVRLNACIHSMRGQNVTLKDLLPGFAVAEKGGVVLIAELQQQGYAYLRP
jgi:uncharacterized protein